jgi:hypothetical protein
VEVDTTSSVDVVAESDVVVSVTVALKIYVDGETATNPGLLDKDIVACE